MEVKRLGAWDCRYCNTKRILGNIFECTGCGHPRHKGVRFYQIPDGPIVTKEIQKQLGSGNPNWYCEHCGCGNRDTETLCEDCGAPKGSSPSHEVKVYRDGNVPTSTEEAEMLDPDGESWVEVEHEEFTDQIEEPELNDSYWDEKDQEENFFLEQAIPLSEDTSTSNKNTIIYEKDLSQRKAPVNLKKYGIIALSIFIFLLLSFLVYQTFFNTHKETVTVAQYSWEQKVVVEEYSAQRESSWSTHPPQAYDIEVAYLDTGRDEKVHDGWETISYMDTCSRSVYNSRTCYQTVDNGDGSFSTESYECGSYDTEYYSCTKTRQEEIFHYEDIWDNYFTYTVNSWILTQEFPTSGSDHMPFFADIEIANLYVTGTPVLGQQRVTEIPGRYQILFNCEDEKISKDGYFEKDYPLEEWLLFSEKEEYTIKVNSFNLIIEYPKPK